MNLSIPLLPPATNVETNAVLRQAAQAHRHLAELKGLSGTIPNQQVLLNALSLQEAKDSSAIENIITTQDDLFKEDSFPELSKNAAAKEVRRYAVALKSGFDLIRRDHLLTKNHILIIQEELEENRAGFRKLPGTELRNQDTGEVVYTPPQHPEEIERLMDNLVAFINDDEVLQVDPLIKMAIIHFQFESIHPFYDGNGRTGRIINVLYLVLKDLLNIPVLYLSQYIIQTKPDYYRLLQSVRDDGEWEDWIIYMLKAVEETSITTLHLIQRIQGDMLDYKRRIRRDFKFYSQDLISNLFFHPYTRIEFVMRDLNVSRVTAAKYLDTLSDAGFLDKQKIGRSNYYINRALINSLRDEET